MACASAASLAVGVGRGVSHGGLQGDTGKFRKPQQLSLSASALPGGGDRAEGAATHALQRNLRWGASAVLSNGSALCLMPQACQLRRSPMSSLVSIVAAGTIERSYIMIKPDGVQRGLIGEIISRFERKGFTLKGLKLFQTPQELAEEHYGELKEKPFFPNLVKYILSGPVVAMVWEGPGVVASARKLIGVTNPLNAEPGTIRGDFGVNTGRNVIHGSDSPANGEREIGLWFKEGEVIDWEPSLTPWILE